MRGGDRKVGPGAGGDRRSRREREGAKRGRGALADLPTHPGLCATCVHLELVGSKRSVFVRCALSDEDPRFPRYPPLPVRACAGYEKQEE